MHKYLINEINEARIFFKDSSVKGKSAKKLADLAFTMIMALEITRQSREHMAMSYANRTLKYQEFDTIYSNTTDLYNILVVLNDQTKFAEYITVDTSISFPKMQFKRYLRDVISGHADPSADRTFFIRLESYFKIDDSYLKIVRRTVCDWNTTASKADKKHAKSLLDNKFRQMAQYIDLNLIFADIRV